MPENKGIAEVLVLVFVWGWRVVDDRVDSIVRGPGYTIVNTVGDGLGLLALPDGLTTRQGLRNRVL